MSRRHYTDKGKTHIIREFQNHHGSTADFCRQRGISCHTFANWRRRTEASFAISIKVSIPSASSSARSYVKTRCREKYLSFSTATGIALNPEVLEMVLSGIKLKDGLQRTWYKLPNKILYKVILIIIIILHSEISHLSLAAS